MPPESFYKIPFIKKNAKHSQNERVRKKSNASNN